MAHTMSLIESTNSLEVEAIVDSGLVTGTPLSAWRRATSLIMAICDRLEPMSSCRSVAIRVRTRSSSISRATRYWWTEKTAPAAAKAASVTNHQLRQIGGRILNVTTAGERLIAPSALIERTWNR